MSSREAIHWEIMYFLCPLRHCAAVSFASCIEGFNMCHQKLFYHCFGELAWFFTVRFPLCKMAVKYYWMGEWAENSLLSTSSFLVPKIVLKVENKDRWASSCLHVTHATLLHWFNNQISWKQNDLGMEEKCATWECRTELLVIEGKLLPRKEEFYWTASILEGEMW